MAATHNSWLLLLAYLGAAASSATHSSGQPRARLVSDAIPDGRLHKRTGLPCFVGTLLPKTRTVLDNWSTSHYAIRRTAPLSLLATATSPAGGAEREVESDGRRTCLVFSPGETVSYEKALGWQQKLQRERIDHKVSSRGKVSRAPGPRTHAAQWAPSSRSQDHAAWQADAVSLPDALILLEHPTARTPLFSLLQLLSKASPPPRRHSLPPRAVPFRPPPQLYISASRATVDRCTRSARPRRCPISSSLCPQSDSRR